MAESDPVKRLRAAARRATEPATVESQHRWYMEELEQTIGRDPSGSGGWHRERLARGLWLGPVLLILSVSAVMFTATLAVLLWRDGTLSRYFDSAPPVRTQEVRHWILADQETGRPSPVPTGKAPKSDVPPNEIEPLIQPPPAPPETAEPEVAAEPVE